ncbi:hypothetical protein DB346_07400 [Verrucomicrobia bacterium LW23]|nr:hypothetical protein DB346_07400 [Verrucomicrobia bacterium LW23]
MSHLPRVLFAGRHNARPGQHTALHQHSSWEFVYYIKGSIISQLPSDLQHPTRTAIPGVAWLTPPRTMHGELALTAFSCFYIGLDMPEDTPWPRWVEDDQHQSIANICRALIAEQGADQGYPVPDPQRSTMQSLLLQQLAIHLRRGAEERTITPRQRLVTRAERILRERSAQPVRLAEVARELGTCPATLRQAFAAERRTSARAFLQEVRLHQALALLKTSSLKLEAVAELTGHDSASHLTRMVKKATGRTPGVFRHGREGGAADR